MKRSFTSLLLALFATVLSNSCFAYTVTVISEPRFDKQGRCNAWANGQIVQADIGVEHCRMTQEANRDRSGSRHTAELVINKDGVGNNGASMTHCAFNLPLPADFAILGAIFAGRSEQEFEGKGSSRQAAIEEAIGYCRIPNGSVYNSLKECVEGAKKSVCYTTNARNARVSDISLDQAGEEAEQAL